MDAILLAPGYRFGNQGDTAERIVVPEPLRERLSFSVDTEPIVVEPSRCEAIRTIREIGQQ